MVTTRKIIVVKSVESFTVHTTATLLTNHFGETGTVIT